MDAHWIYGSVFGAGPYSILGISLSKLDGHILDMDPKPYRYRLVSSPYFSMLHAFVRM